MKVKILKAEITTDGKTHSDIYGIMMNGIDIKEQIIFEFIMNDYTMAIMNGKEKIFQYLFQLISLMYFNEDTRKTVYDSMEVKIFEEKDFDSEDQEGIEYFKVLRETLK